VKRPVGKVMTAAARPDAAQIFTNPQKTSIIEMIIAYLILIILIDKKESESISFWRYHACYVHD
jgi:hypothetical protein